jgi:opacity protein-like surface antigen
MKKILIATTLAGLLFPAIASAELNYNVIEASYAQTSESGWPDVTEYDFNASYGITKNIYLDGTFATFSQPSGTAFGDFTGNAFALGAGYHTPLQKNVDLIVAGHLIHGTASFAGSSYSSNGYDIGVGVRAELTPELETILSVVHTSLTSNSFTTTSNGIQAQLGYKVTPQVELFAGLGFDSNSPDIGSSYDTQTIGFGGRFYY